MPLLRTKIKTPIDTPGQNMVYLITQLGEEALVDIN